jgi:hypothetical protein
MIKVYHNSQVVQFMVEPTLESLKKGYFEYVAEVETEDLDQAYTDTNNIDKAWSTNTNVKAVRRENRSTSVGDLLEKESKFFLVLDEGFRELSREEECTITFYLRGGSMKEATKSDISRQLAKELNVSCIDLPLSDSPISDFIESPLLKSTVKPPEVIEHAELFKSKGYTTAIQFEENGKPFGEPLMFKTATAVSDFMWNNPKMKMTWHKNL